MEPLLYPNKPLKNRTIGNNNFGSSAVFTNDLAENLVKAYCCGLSVCKMEVTQYTLSTHQTVAISVVLAYLFCHHKRVN